MPKYIRPPEGKYSEHMLSVLDEMGYTTVFWSFAYKDWLKDDQPDPAASVEKILSRTHPGAIILLHSTSHTNAEILPEVLRRWKEAGYTVKSLDDLVAQGKAQPSAAGSPAPSASVSPSAA